MSFGFSQHEAPYSHHAGLPHSFMLFALSRMYSYSFSAQWSMPKCKYFNWKPQSQPFPHRAPAARQTFKFSSDLTQFAPPAQGAGCAHLPIAEIRIVYKSEADCFWDTWSLPRAVGHAWNLCGSCSWVMEQRLFRFSLLVGVK